MAQNVRLRITNNEDITQYYYWYVGFGNGYNQSGFAYLGSASSGQTLTTAELEHDGPSNGDYFSGYGARNVYTSDSELTSLDSYDYHTYSWGSYGGNPQNSAGIYPRHASSFPRIASSSAGVAYYLDITQPSGSSAVESSSETFGTWAQYDSSDNLLDTTTPSLVTASFPNSSSNDEIKLVFSERINDSSGNLFTAATFPTITWDTSQTTGTDLENFGIDSVTYSQTTTANDTITLGISYDGSITGGSVSLSFGSYTVYDLALNELRDNLSTGQIDWPTTSTSSRTYVDRTFKIYNASGSSGYAYIQVDSGEGDDGSSYLYLGEVSAGGTGSFVVSDLYHNDRKYTSSSDDYYILMSTVSGSISGSSWAKWDLGSGVYSQKAFVGYSADPSLGSDDTRVRWDITWSGLSSGFGDWTVYNSSGVALDLGIGSTTYSVTNSNGTGSYVIDAGEKLYKASSYNNASSFSDLAEIGTSDFYGMYAYGPDYGSSNISNVSITNVSYQTSDDSGAMAIYGTDSTYGEGWFYPVYLSDPGSSHTHTFSEYSGTTFYMPDSGANHASTTRPSSYVNYHDQLVITFTYDGSATTSDWVQPSFSSTVYDANVNSSYLSFPTSSTMQADSSSPPPSSPPPSPPPPPPPSSPPPSPPSSPGETESEYISSTGGTVTTSGGSVSIPSAALSSAVTIQMDVSDTSSIQESDTGLAAAVGDPTAVLMSPVISLTPHGQQFDQAVTVEFDLIGSSAGSCPSNLQIWKRNNDSGTWYQLPSNLWSCSDGTISISTTSFSQFQAIGGQGMARTQLNNAQLSKLVESNKSLTDAIDITGSAAFTGTITGTDKFMIQSSTGVASQVSASVMQSYFSSVDLIEASGSTRHAMVMAVSGSTDDAKLYVDAGIEYLPSTEEFFIHGDITVEGGKVTLSNGATIDSETADELKLTEDQISIIGALSGSSTLDIAGVASFASDITASAGLQVAQEADINGALDVAGNSNLQGTLDVAGLASFASDITASAGLQVAQEADINGALDVAGNSNLQGTLDVAGLASFASDVTASAGMSISEELQVGGNLTLSGTGSIAGDLTVSGDLTVNGSVTTVNTEEVTIADHNIVLDSNNSLSDVVSGAGITLNANTGDDITFQYDGSDSMDLKKGSSFYKLHMGDIQADGAADLNSTLDVAGVASFASDITASAGLYVTQEIHVDGAADLDGALDVAGLATFASDITASAGLQVAQEADINGALDVAGNSNLQGTLDVAGLASFASDITASAGLQVAQEADINGALDVAGASNLQGTLDVAGLASFASDITASAGLQVAQEADINGALDVAGDSNLQGTLDVAGLASFASDITASAGLQVAQEADINGALDVAGNSNLQGTLDVAGLATFASDISASAGLHVTQEIHVDGAAQFDNADVQFTALDTVADDAIASAAKMVFLDGSTAKSISLGELGEYLADEAGGGVGIHSDSDGHLSIVAGQKLLSGSAGLTNLTGSISEDPVENSVQVFLNGMLLTPSSSAAGAPAVFDYTYDYASAPRDVCFVAGVVEANDAVVIHYLKK